MPVQISHMASLVGVKPPEESQKANKDKPDKQRSTEALFKSHKPQYQGIDDMLFSYILDSAEEQYSSLSGEYGLWAEMEELMGQIIQENGGDAEGLIKENQQNFAFFLTQLEELLTQQNIEKNFVKEEFNLAGLNPKDIAEIMENLSTLGIAGRSQQMETRFRELLITDKLLKAYMCKTQSGKEVLYGEARQLIANFVSRTKIKEQEAKGFALANKAI